MTTSLHCLSSNFPKDRPCLLYDQRDSDAQRVVGGGDDEDEEEKEDEEEDVTHMPLKRI